MKQKRDTVELHLYFPTRNFLYGEWRVCACACMENLGWRLFVIKAKKETSDKKNHARNSKTLVKRVICRKIWEEQKKRKTFDVLR